jgi:integrase
MPRRIRSASLETRSARLRLPPAKRCHWVRLGDGVSLGYRRLHGGAGTWSVKCADGSGGRWIKKIGAVGDDYEESNGTTVLTYTEAQQRCRDLARGTNADVAAGRPPTTLGQALDDYAGDLRARRADARNVSSLRRHLSASMLSMPISLITMRTLRAWRDGLLATMKASSANRRAHNLRAVLNLAAKYDRRIINAREWREALSHLPEDDVSSSNIVLDDRQLREVCAEAYRIGENFGAYVECHIVTGSRSSQIALLDVRDLQMDGLRLTVPSSLKGGGRTSRTRIAVPITQGLAERLHVAPAGRADHEPLLRQSNGKRWNVDAHRKPFAAIAKKLKLPEGATMYCLRHTSITRQLLAGVPVRVVAATHDTSIVMVEKTYSRHIAVHGDALTRGALLDLGAPADDAKVVRMRKR